MTAAWPATCDLVVGAGWLYTMITPLPFRRRRGSAARDGARLRWLKTDVLDDSAEGGLFRRFTCEELAEFAESLVRPKGERFEIVSGYHRLRAARLLGREEILCVVRDLPDEEAASQLIDANIKGRTPGPWPEGYRQSVTGRERGRTGSFQILGELGAILARSSQDEGGIRWSKNSV